MNAAPLSQLPQVFLAAEIAGVFPDAHMKTIRSFWVHTIQSKISLQEDRRTERRVIWARQVMSETAAEGAQFDSHGSNVSQQRGG